MEALLSPGKLAPERGLPVVPKAAIHRRTISGRKRRYWSKVSAIRAAIWKRLSSEASSPR